jgi:hypothetical protein
LGKDFSNGFLLEDASPATKLRGVARSRRPPSRLKNTHPFTFFKILDVE